MTGRITVAEAIGRTIAREGAGHTFGVVGSGNFHMTNALIDEGVGFTATRHEMGAACAADAYSRLTGTVAIVSVHQGGGYLNALTGVLEGVKAHSRLVVLAGAVARGEHTSNFALDQVRAFEALGGLAIRVETAADAIHDAATAIRAAATRRIPVLLDVPVDIQDELVDWDPDALPPAPRIVPSGADPESLAQLVEALAGAERPLIVGGRGAHHAKAELRALGEAAGAVLAASAAGRGIFVGEEWALDVMGGFATPAAAELMLEADLIVVFGVALTKWTARGGVLTEGKRIIQVDDRAEAIGFHRPVDVAVIGDARLVARAATEALRERIPEGRIAWRSPETRERIRRVRYWAEQEVEFHPKPGFVDPAELAQTLDGILPLERVLVPDGGNVNTYTGAFFRVPDENGYVMSLASQSIGLGLAEGIGAAVARPDRLTLVATGDGSILMNAVELETACRLGLGMLILVLNDSAYGAEVHLFHDDPKQDIVRFPETDIAAIARGYGCEAITVRSLDDLEPLHAWLAGPRERPFLIDAKIEGFPSPVMALRFH